MIQSVRRACLLLPTLALSLSLAASAQAAPSVTGPGHVRVRGIQGQASLVASNSAPIPLQPGADLAEGVTIQTGPNSALDLDLGKLAGTIRLTQNTTVVLDKLPASDTLPENEIEIRLHVLDGAVVGFDNKLTTAARFDIKVSNGIAAVGGSRFRIHARGYIVNLEGTLLFAYVPPGGDPVAHTLKAKPPVYFSPYEGIRLAPAALVNEVQKQIKAKLPTR